MPSQGRWISSSGWQEGRKEKKLALRSWQWRPAFGNRAFQGQRQLDNNLINHQNIIDFSSGQKPVR